MRLVFIYGPPASGKLTVARELSKLTGFRLFHNHVSIQFVESLFEFGTRPFQQLIDKYRLEMLEEAARHRIDTIFTFVYSKNDDPFVRSVVRKVHSFGGRVFFVRLHCDRKELERRINNKSREAWGKITSKLTLRQLLRRLGPDTEAPFKPSLTIDTTNQSPKKAARTIAQFYSLRVQK